MRRRQISWTVVAGLAVTGLAGGAWAQLESPFSNIGVNSQDISDWATEGSTNLALAGTAFAQDEVNASFGASSAIDGVIDASSGWVGASTDTFLGVALAAPATVNRVAFGDPFGNRPGNIIEVQVTTVASPSAATPDGEWATVGTVYPAGVPDGHQSAYGGDPNVGVAIRSRLFRFPAVQDATGVRLKFIASPNEPAIGELQVYGPEPGMVSEYAMIGMGGRMEEGATAGLVNWCREPGATAFSQDDINGDWLAPGLNDGSYAGAPNEAWIAGSAVSFGGVALASPETVAYIAFSRPRDPGFEPRVLGLARMQVTTEPAPDATTPDGAWTTVALFEQFAPLDESAPNGRRLFQIDPPVSNVTGVRLQLVSGSGAPCSIGELEAYGPRATPFAKIERLGAAGAGPTAGETNLSLASTGFAQDVLNDDVPSWGPQNLLDGDPGTHWIGSPPEAAFQYWAPTFVGARLAAPAPVDRVAVTFPFSNRSVTGYEVQVTTVANPDEFTPEQDWETVGGYDSGFIFRDLGRHLFQFQTRNDVTAVRIYHNESWLLQPAMNELEIYEGVPFSDVADWSLLSY